jgi:hypothetical protein
VGIRVCVVFLSLYATLSTVAVFFNSDAQELVFSDKLVDKQYPPKYGAHVTQIRLYHSSVRLDDGNGNVVERVNSDEYFQSVRNAGPDEMDPDVQKAFEDLSSLWDALHWMLVTMCFLLTTLVVMSCAWGLTNINRIKRTYFFGYSTQVCCRDIQSIQHHLV